MPADTSLICGSDQGQQHLCETVPVPDPERSCQVMDADTSWPISDSISNIESSQSYFVFKSFQAITQSQTSDQLHKWNRYNDN